MRSLTTTSTRSVGCSTYPHSSFPTGEVEKVVTELGLEVERDGRVVLVRPSESGSSLDTDQILQNIRGESPWSDSWVTSLLVTKSHPLLNDRDLVKYDLDQLIVLTPDRTWGWYPDSIGSEERLIHKRSD